jgi:hypothetical protein
MKPKPKPPKPCPYCRDQKAVKYEGIWIRCPACNLPPYYLPKARR